ncbi:MAG: GNAT family N-acetyltransferase [Siphonobacter sp.]
MITFTLKRFNELTLQELYDLLALRTEVFIVEQNCPYQDADGNDTKAWHCLGKDEQGKLLAYTRLFNVDVSYAGYTSIGRVVTSPASRGKGLGRILMEHSIASCQKLFGSHPIKIGAQSYLLDFYESLGFVSTGIEYLEDGIPHTYMIRP